MGRSPLDIMVVVVVVVVVVVETSVMNCVVVGTSGVVSSTHETPSLASVKPGWHEQTLSPGPMVAQF